MTSFSPEPEFWVEDASEDWADGDWGGGDDGVPPGGPPGGEQPPPGPRRWPRWVALAAGLAVIAGLIAWQSRTGNNPAPTSDQTTTQTPPTAPSTSATADGPTSLVSGAAERCCLTVTTDPPETTGAEGQPPTTTVITADLPGPASLADAAWELVGFRWSGSFADTAALVRYRPATGELVTTPVPRPDSNGGLGLVVTPDAALIQPRFSTDGYLVPDGADARPLSGLLAEGNVVLPGPDSGHVWVLQGDDALRDALTSQLNENTRQPPYSPMPAQLALVDVTGTPTGTVIDIPDTDGNLSPSYQVFSDGAGFALFYGVGGVYGLGPGGTQLVTHGQVLATGPATMLLNECDESAHCAPVVLDRGTGDRRILSAAAPPATYEPGITSPDGRVAVIRDALSGSLLLLDLESGQTTIRYQGRGSNTYDAAPAPAFTPDSQYLLLAGEEGVEVVENASGRTLGTLPLPGLIAIAIRPAG